jgi:segregation and condensation protein A
MLELSQQRFMKLLVGEGRNNFIIEWNDKREEELIAEGIDINEIHAVTVSTTDSHEEDAALLN